MKTIFTAALACALLLPAAAQALEVRFFPAARVYTYELDAAHGASSLIVHNIAIINDSAAPVTLSDVAIDLMSGERALDTRTLGAEELTRAAVGGAQMQQGGLLEILPFQFGGADLLHGAALSADLSLEPGEAILIASQVFAFRGARDGVRVRVNGDAGEGRLPIRSGASQTAFTLPLRGQWYTAAGASFHTHHRWTPMEEFAFDFIQLDAAHKTHSGDGARFTDYYAYGQPVFAAAAGRVAVLVDGEQEDAAAMQQPGETIETYFERLQQDQFTRIARGPPGVGGNQIMIEHANGEFSFYGHLKPGSISVHVGDQVALGQQIGAVGSSGNSTEPHLHFHVCDSADMFMCAGIPVRFDPPALETVDRPRAPQTGDFMSSPH